MNFWTAPGAPLYGLRGRSVFIHLLAAAFAVVSCVGTSSAATFLGGVSVQDGRSAEELVFASGGSPLPQNHHVQTFELGIGMPLSGNLEGGIFTTFTSMEASGGRVLFRVLGGSIGRPLILGSNLDIRFGLGVGTGGGAGHESVGINEFVFFLPIPGVPMLGVFLVHQILIIEGISAGFDVIHINRIGLTARLRR